MNISLRSQNQKKGHRESRASEDDRLYLTEHPVLDDEEEEDVDDEYHSLHKTNRSRFFKLGLIFITVAVIILSTLAIIYYTQSSSSSTEPNMFQCKHTIVGTGYGGLYYLWRLSLSSVSSIFQAKDFCIFEASYRVGGRAYAYRIENQNVIVDLGAPKFSRAHELISGLIKTVLGLPVICDNGGEIACVNASGYEVIRDIYGNNGGFSQAILQILDIFQTKGGPSVYFNHELVNVQDSNDNDFPFLLTFKNGVQVHTQTVLLNIPPENLGKLDKSNVLVQKSDNLTLAAIFNTMEYPIAKMYVEYSDAWWLTKLNLTTGSVEWEDGQLPSVHVRYADGPVKCKIDSDGTYSPFPIAGGNCWGFLQMSYASDLPSVNYLTTFGTPQDATRDVSISIPFGDPQGGSLITQSHQRLMDYHRPLFEALGLNTSIVPLPSSVVISIWNSRYSSYPSEHLLVDGNGNTINDPYWETRNRVPIPIPNYNLFLANEAWCNCGWAEGSLIMVERLLQKRYSLVKPDWVSESYWQNSVIPWLSPSQECYQDNECQIGIVNPCLNATCKLGTCVYDVPINNPCDDGDLCTIDDRCTSDGVCLGNPLPCGNSTICINGTCEFPLPPTLPKCHATIDPLQIYWDFLSSDEIRIAFSLPGTAMIGLGFGTTMTASDLIIGWVDSDGAFHVDDYYASAPDIPSLDTTLGGTSDVSQIYGVREGNQTTLWFQRKLDTGDAYDTMIREGQNSIIFAWADGEKPGLTYHGENRRPNQTINLVRC